MPCWYHEVSFSITVMVMVHELESQPRFHLGIGVGHFQWDGTHLDDTYRIASSRCTLSKATIGLGLHAHIGPATRECPRVTMHMGGRRDR